MKDSLGAVQSVLVLGGGSDIGAAIAGRLARPRKASVVLAGPHPSSLDLSAARVKEAGAGSVATIAFDALEPASHDQVIAKAAEATGGDLDVVVMAFGLLGDQEADEHDDVAAARVASVNYVGAVSAGLAAARRLKQQGHGVIVVISSVAGERVRRANFIYGSSKAGMDGFAQGLGDSLQGTGVRVLIVRPGFVRTKMTDGRAEAPMAVTAEEVALATERALASGRDVVWVPAQLRAVFALFRHLPRPLWRRLPM